MKIKYSIDPFYYHPTHEYTIVFNELNIFITSSLIDELNRLLSIIIDPNMELERKIIQSDPHLWNPIEQRSFLTKDKIMSKLLNTTSNVTYFIIHKTPK